MTALNRMPAALLKQSKDFRFLTLRRYGRPLSEIASAAGEADACEYCSPQDCAGRSLCPAEARSRSQMLTLRPPQAAARVPPSFRLPSANSGKTVKCEMTAGGSPQAAARKLSHYDTCDSLLPHVADCISPEGSCESSAVGEQHAKKLKCSPRDVTPRLKKIRKNYIVPRSENARLSGREERCRHVKC